MPIPHQLEAVQAGDLLREVKHFLHGCPTASVTAQTVAIRAVSKSRQARAESMVLDHESLLFVMRQNSLLGSFVYPLAD
jgi:hypothetical protein